MTTPATSAVLGRVFPILRMMPPFLRPSQSETDGGRASDKHQYLDILDDGSYPAGPMLTGGGPLPQNKGVDTGPPLKAKNTKPFRTNDGF